MMKSLNLKLYRYIIFIAEILKVCSIQYHVAIFSTSYTQCQHKTRLTFVKLSFVILPFGRNKGESRTILFFFFCCLKLKLSDRDTITQLQLQYLEIWLCKIVNFFQK